jgi:N-acetyl-gamma-glutamylphosphate reductase
MKSGFLSLNVQDAIRGIIVAVGTAAATVLVPILQAGVIPSGQQVRTSALSGVAAGIVYVLKNLFTNSNDQLGKSEPRE